MGETAVDEPVRQWFVMRDLKRANAKNPAYAMLSDLGFKVFTPMTTRIALRNGKKERRDVPFIQDLLFVNATREELDPVVRRTDTLQYRFLKGHTLGTAMTVADHDMATFIAAVSSVATPHYYHLDEITPEMYGARVRIVSQGSFDGLEGTLLKIKGARKKRVLIQLPGLLAAGVEVGSADLIEEMGR
ncbi:MAG: UpxY family transcription antiterminator [Bacteroidales bacterium]|nr:UpxY family transcription antiterminator [Bacteroidales bacterium]